MSTGNPEFRVLRNSIYLSIQPFILNIISIFIFGYIARKLGPSDFGIFNFINIFIMLFFPIGIMGLDNVAVRELSSLRHNKPKFQSYFGKILSLRILLALLVILLISLFANILGYSERIIYSIYIGTAIVLFQLLGESITDIFRSFERMEFVALAQLIGGLTLTILSVAILYFGYGLFELIGVYAFGQLLIFIIALVINRRYFVRIRLEFSPKFFKASLFEGLPFFLTAEMWYLIERFDTIFISKYVNPESLGIYTTAIILVTRLSVIPQSIGNSLYPTLSNFFAFGQNNKIADIIRLYYKFIIMIATPTTILLSFYSEKIILIIAGDKYITTGYILRFTVWIVFIRLFGSINFSILAAMKKQKLIVIIYTFTLIFCLFVNFMFTTNYKIPGAVVALISTQLVLVILLFVCVNKEIPHLLDLIFIIKIICLNICFIAFLFFINNFNYFAVDYPNLLVTTFNTIIISFTALLLYFCMLIFFKIIKISDLYKLKNIFSF